MSEKTKDDKKAPAAKVKAMRCEVLENGFKSRAGTAARGARINLSADDATLFEKAGKVRILGVA